MITGRITSRGIILAVCSSAFCIGYFSRLSWGILTTYSSLHGTIYDDSVIFSLFFVGYTISQIPAGLLADRISPRFIIGPAMIGVALGSALSGIAGSISVEMSASFLTGLAAGWIISPSLKLMASMFHTDRLAVALGYYSVAWPLAIVASGLVLPTSASLFGWRAPYYALTGISLAIAVLILYSTEYGKSQNRFDLSVARDRRVILLAAGEFIFFFGYWILALYGYLYLVSEGLTRIEAGVVYSMLAFAGLPSSAISGYIMNRVGTRNTLCGSVIVYAGFLLMFSLAAGFYPLLFLVMLMGFFRFMVTPSLTAVASILGGSTKTGSVSGIANFFAQASGAIGPLFASLLIPDMGYTAVWFTVVALTVAASCVFMQLKI